MSNNRELKGRRGNYIKTIKLIKMQIFHDNNCGKLCVKCTTATCVYGNAQNDLTRYAATRKP